MKKYLSFLAYLIFLFVGLNIFYAVVLIAAPVSEQTAKQIAENFIKNCNQFQNNVPISLYCKSMEHNLNKSNKVLTAVNPYYYVYNVNPNGFIIISADDATHPVLGYSNEVPFDSVNIPPMVAEWLEGYKSQIRYLITNNLQPNNEIIAEWNRLKNEKNIKYKILSSVAPLVQTKWNQSPYYNDLCPYDNYSHERAVTGCAATAMAQIMKFWNYPTTGMGFHSYNSQKYGTLSANFGSTTYNWSDMPNSINSPNSSIATLMYHCGVSVDMNYNTSKSGGSGAWVINGDSPLSVQNALQTYFGYASTMQGLKRANYPDDSKWIGLLTNELDNGRPIQYVGYGSEGGHTFVCDGYDNNGYFHMNWGWGGLYDGYFILNALNPGSGGIGSGTGSYNEGQEALIGIHRPDNAISYNLALFQNVSISSNVIGYGQGFTVSTGIVNRGNNTFTGNFCAAVFDENNAFIDYVAIDSNISLPTNSYYGITFNTTQLYSMLPGNYNIYVYYIPINGQNWIPLNADVSNPYLNTYIQIQVINPNDIELNSAITVYPDTLIQGQSASVNLNIHNNGNSTFKGLYQVDLYNLDGTFVQTINSYYENDGLLPNYTYKPPYLNFDTSLISVNPGTYLLAVEYYSYAINQWQLTGTGNYQNPIKVTVSAPKLQADIYEPNNDLASSYNLNVNYLNNIANVSTDGSNIHIGNDIDYYKIGLSPGYSYTINADIYDANGSKDGNNYTEYCIISYSLDGQNWSTTINNLSPIKINLTGTNTLYFKVSPLFLGVTGTYLLDLNITRSLAGEVNELNQSNAINIYPNPASDIININFLKDISPLSEIKLNDIFGRTYFLKNNFVGQKLEIPTNGLNSGMYFLILSNEDGVQLTKKICVQK